MPSLLELNCTKWLNPHGDHEKRTQIPGVHSTNIIETLENQLRQGSIEAAIQLTSQLGFKVDHDYDCEQCNKIASYFVYAFQSLKRNTKSVMLCDSILLNLVQQSIDLLQAHNNYASDSIFSTLFNELRDVGKFIKDQSMISDKYVPLPVPSTFKFEDQPLFKDQTDLMHEDFGRAIRICIYYFRASRYENQDINQSIYYYRKCLSVLPTQFDYNQKNLQQSAMVSLQHYEGIICNSNNTSRRSSIILSSRTPSTVSVSTSSGESISSSCARMTCSNCGVEKQRMPICSKCKSQSYCSIRCLKIHKPIHDTECHLH